MPKTPLNENEDSFRSRFFGKAEIPILVRLFGLYLAVPLAAISGAAGAVMIANQFRAGATGSVGVFAGAFGLILVATACYLIGRGLQTGYRWAIWATMGFCLTASLVATAFFSERLMGLRQAGSFTFFALVLPSLAAFVVGLRNRSKFQPLSAVTARRIGTSIKWGLPALVSVLALAYIGLSVAASRYENRVNAEWAKVAFSPSDFPKKFPKAEANQTAKVITNMIASEATYSRKGSPDRQKLLDPKASFARAFEITDSAGQPPWKDGWKTVADILEKPGDGIGPFAPEVVAYLDKHAGDFGALYRQIQAEAPQWELDVSKNVDAPVPNILEHRVLLYLIALDALAKSGQGKDAEALAALDCAWIVNQSMYRRPELLSELIGISGDKVIALTVRKMKNPGTEWRKRYSNREWRDGIRTSLVCEAYGMVESAKTSGLAAYPFTDEGQSPVVRGIWAVLTRPLARYWAVELSEAHLRVAERLSKLDGCDDTRDPFADIQTLGGPGSPLSSSNRIASVFQPNANAIWRSEIKASYIFEMTEKILIVKEFAASNGGAPTSVVDGMRSGVCSKGLWQYQVLPDKTFSLTYTPRPTLFDKDNEAEKDRLFVIQWPVGSGQKSVVSSQ